MAPPAPARRCALVAARARAGTALLVVAVAASTLLGVALASPALAQSVDCAAVFTDPDGLDPAGEPVVTAAADDLAQEHDVFVRVRLLATTGTQGLDEWAEAALDACPGWQAADGAARADLVLVAVAVEDRAIGSYFGTTTARRLDPARSEVHGQMGALLADGDLAEGLALGLDLYGDVLRRAAAAAAAPPEAPATQRSVLPWALGGAAVVGAGAAGGIALTRSRQRREIQVTAEKARTAAMSAYYDLEERWETIAAGVTVMTQATHPDDGVAATVLQESDEAERALASVRDDLLATPDPGELHDRAQVDAAVEVWNSLVEQVDRVGTEIDEVDAALTSLQQAREQSPARIQQALAAVEEARGAIATTEDQGFRASSARAWSDEATRIAASAQAAFDQGRFGDALAAADTALERGEAGRARAKRIPHLARVLPVQADDLQSASATVLKSAKVVEGVLRDMQRRWHRTVWDDISDAAAQLGDLAEAVRSHADDVRSAVTEQDWDAALAGLEEGQELVEEATALAALPEQRHKEAAAQFELVRGLYEEARQDLMQAESMFAGTVAEVGPYQSAVRAAARQLDKGRALLGDKPDPIRARAIVDEANASLESAVHGAEQAIRAHDQAVDRARNLVSEGRRRQREAEVAQPRSAAWRRQTNRADDLLDEAERLLDRDPLGAQERARRGRDLANDVIREKRRARDRDRDEWRTSSVQRGSSARAGRPRPSSSTTALGGSSFGGGGSTKRDAFGGGGSSKF